MPVRVAAPDPRRSVLLRGALAVPLVYVLLRALPGHWSWVFPSGQATDFYAINGLLYFIPLGVWCAALVLLGLGSGNRIAWAVVAGAGVLVAVYGLLPSLEPHAVEPGLLASLNVHAPNADFAFGLYVAFLGAWQLSAQRGGGTPEAEA